MSSAHAYLGLVAAVALERLWELRLSRRNRRLMLAAGGRETGAAAFRVMAVLHAGFLVACAVEVIGLRRAFTPLVGLPALGLVLAAQSLRYWAMAALGNRWNVRIVVVPGLPPVTSGPYRWLRHPNYLAVIVEMAALPMVHGAWITAVVFSVANGVVLAARVRAEEDALGAAYGTAFDATPRFVPRAGPRGGSAA